MNKLRVLFFILASFTGALNGSDAEPKYKQEDVAKNN